MAKVSIAGCALCTCKGWCSKMYYDDSVLECDQCGDVIRRLTVSEAQQVALDPYNFIVYCDDCKRNGLLTEW